METQRPQSTAVLDALRMSDGRDVSLHLEPFDVMSSDGIVLIQSRAGQQAVQARDIVHLYRGHVVGDDAGTVFLAASAKQMNGFIRFGDELHMISSGPFTGGLPDQLHVTAARELGEWLVNGPVCGYDQIEQPVMGFDPRRAAASDSARGTCTIIELAMDSDWEYTEVVFDGDAVESAAYAVTLAAGVSEIFSNELTLQLSLGYVRTWADDSDPYDPNGDDMLNQFGEHWRNEMSGIDRDVAHVLSGRDNLPYGGVAWGSTLCSYDWGYSVSGYLNGSFPYPLEDNNGGNWDLVVMSHELGHNFGSPHTHDLGIDGCAFGDCSLSADGTIMSYCHTCPGGISNIRLGFNEQIKDTMYSLLEERTCDETGEDVAALDDVVSTFANYDVDIDVLLNDIGASCAAQLVELGTFDTTSANGGDVTYLPPSPMQPRERLNYDPPLGFTGTDPFYYSLATGKEARVDVNVGSAESVLNVPLDYPTVQMAINAATTGDEIRVGPGVYTDTGAAVLDFQGKSIWVHSTNGPEATILDGEGNRPVVLLTGLEGSTTVLQGFTIRNGFASIGGGIRCNGSPQIIQCIIRDNVGVSITGGLMSSDTTGPSLQSVEFCNNTPSNYFGNWVDDGDNTESTTCAVAGICCFGVECDSGLYQYECATSGGEWLGSDAVCEDCFGPQGACCYDEDCTGSAYESDCIAGGGLWLGGGADCDDCVEDCPGDANGDGQVSVDDLLAIITVWGQSCDGCSEDLDASGAIGVDDLLQVIANWQSPCP